MIGQCAGDVGDALYAMCAFRALGGGALALHSEKWTREHMTDEKVDSLRSLLINQPYIEEVRWLQPGDKVDVNLNDFRAHYFKTFKHPDFPKRRNLCEWILRTHGVDPVEQNKRWLTGIEPLRTVRVIINRTSRYQNERFPWDRVIDQYRNSIAFVGTKREHADFSQQFEEVPYIETTSLLALARVIAGADLFIGNQSCPYAIAEAMKKPAVLEVCAWLPNCLFQRPDVIHGWDANVALPEL